MIRRPPRSTLDRSSAASDVYKRQVFDQGRLDDSGVSIIDATGVMIDKLNDPENEFDHGTVSYTHLRAHETVLDLVCRLLLEKKK